MGNCHTTGPNEVMVISGGCSGDEQKRYIIGGWGWAWCCVTDVQRLTLELLTLHPVCKHVETSEGVPLHVMGVAQVKVKNNDEFLRRAAEQFLGKNKTEIAATVLQTIECHLRAVLGTLTVEEICRDIEKFAMEVRKVAAPDVARMGIELISFVIKDICDRVDYLASLGRAQSARVKRDTAIVVAEANRDAEIREGECEKDTLASRYEMDSRIAECKRRFDLMQATFDEEINSQIAEVELAYELQEAKTRQKIRAEEIEIEVVERRKEIRVEEKEMLRKEKELAATIQLSAEAEAYRVQQIAECYRVQTVEAARGEAEKIRLIGEAQATSIEAVGKAEAERMRLKAAAYKQYGDAAMVSLILETLPKIAAEVTTPLAKVVEIVTLNDDRMTSEVSRLLSQLPPTGQALREVDLSKGLREIPGAK